MKLRHIVNYNQYSIQVSWIPNKFYFIMIYVIQNIIHILLKIYTWYLKYYLKLIFCIAVIAIII